MERKGTSNQKLLQATLHKLQDMIQVTTLILNQTQDMASNKSDLTICLGAMMQGCSITFLMTIK